MAKDSLTHNPIFVWQKKAVKTKILDGKSIGKLSKNSEINQNIWRINSKFEVLVMGKTWNSEIMFLLLYLENINWNY